MNTIDCCGLIKYCCQQIGLLEEHISIGEASERINNEAEKWDAEDHRGFWADFTQQPAKVSSLVQKALDKFHNENIQPGVAVELGCGNSMAAIKLLQKGWKVIALDNSKGALENLRKLADQFDPTWIKEKKLILESQDMETYQFPGNVRLVLANDSFPYCNPKKIMVVWARIYDSLETGGRIVGNFFPTPNNPVVERLQRILMGSWFTDKAVVNALLTHSGYEKEVFGYNKYWYEPDPRCIEFIGHKTKQKLKTN